MRPRFQVLVRKQQQQVLRIPLRQGRYLVAPRAYADVSIGALRGILQVATSQVHWLRQDGKLALRDRWVEMDGFEIRAEVIEYPNASQGTFAKEHEEAASTPPLTLSFEGGKVFSSGKREELTLGTDTLNDVSINDRFVSRAHCAMYCRNGRWFVRDTASKNGTYLNGYEVVEAEIRPPAWLMLGDTSIRIERDIDKGNSSGLGLIGKSEAMQQLRIAIARFADSSHAILVSGETGTGKELVALALHGQGPRAAMPFETVNCGALPPNLVESELFGHIKGAFTGAVENRVGAFARADRGTLFLDEIGELPLDLQAKLLRVLETYEIRPVGADKSLRVDVRVIAATHRDLRTLVKEGKFREDLFHRLGVLRVSTPPLRDRREDIPLLVGHFLEKYAPAGQVVTLSAEAEQALSKYSFPGNVRELRNALLRAVVRSGGGQVSADALELDDDRPGPDHLDSVEQEALLRVLKESRGDVSKAARRLGIARSTIYRKMQGWQIPMDRVLRKAGK